VQPLALVGSQDPSWPFFLYCALVIVVAAGILLLSHLLGERHPPGEGKTIPYESGITPTGTARLRYGVHFYTVGIFFILFDVEAVFLYAWAVAMRELGWMGYAEIALFVVVLFLGLVYIWRLGGLDWSPTRRRIRAERQRRARLRRARLAEDAAHQGEAAAREVEPAGGGR